MEKIKKITKRENFEEIARVLADLGKTELVEVMNHEIELLDKKAMNRKSGNSKTQIENLAIMETIVSELTEIAEMVTITELQEKSEKLAKYSNQKLSALLKKLVDADKVKKIIEKKKSYFTVVVD